MPDIAVKEQELKIFLPNNAQTVLDIATIISTRFRTADPHEQELIFKAAVQACFGIMNWD